MAGGLRRAPGHRHHLSLRLQVEQRGAIGSHFHSHRFDSAGGEDRSARARRGRRRPRPGEDRSARARRGPLRPVRLHLAAPAHASGEPRAPPLAAPAHALGEPRVPPRAPGEDGAARGGGRLLLAAAAVSFSRRWRGRGVVPVGGVSARRAGGVVRRAGVVGRRAACWSAWRAGRGSIRARHASLIQKKKQKANRTSLQNRHGRWVHYHLDVSAGPGRLLKKT